MTLKMVKKTEDDWKTSKGNVTTKKYLELCKNYMIANPDVETESKQFLNSTPIIPHTVEAKFGMNDNDIRDIREFTCSICKNVSSIESDGKKIIANPFTRAQYMLVCFECNQTISACR